MQSYAIVLACPLAVLNQHFFSEIRISYKNYKKIVLIYFLWEMLLFLAINYFFNYSMVIKIEYFSACLIGLIVGKFIARFEPKKSLDHYETNEDYIYLVQIFMGIALCFLAVANFSKVYFLSQFSKYEVVLFKIIYFRLGLSYVFYNRKVFCLVHKLRNKKCD